MKRLALLIMALILSSGAFAFTAQHESNQTSPATVNITSDMMYDTITLDVPGNDLACANCSGISGTLSLNAGSYVLGLEAVLGNDTFLENFTLDIYEIVNVTPGNLTNTTAPVNETNVTTNVSTNVTTNVTTNITTNVSTNVTTNVTTNITTNTTTNVTTNVTVPKEEGNGTPRFALGFNKLPQELVAGRISDAELAAILRSNKLNPGIINRLVKTGKLGNASLDAIIETQKTPPGIFAKLGRLIGIDVKTAKDRIPELYNLTAEQQEMLSEDPDVSRETGKVLKEKVAVKQAEKQAQKEQKQAEKQEAKEQNEKLEGATSPKNQTGKPEKAPKNGTGKPADKPRQK